MRRLLAVLPVVSVAALVLVGCSSPDVIDVPESAVVSEVPRAEATPSTAPESTATGPALDCATALPASVVEAGTGLPVGTVASVDSAQGQCVYSIAGNPGAVVVTLGSARLAETFTGQGEAQGATPAPLGSAAYWLEGDGASSPSELAVLSEGYELHVVSYVGDRSTLVDWAAAVLASVGAPLTVV